MSEPGSLQGSAEATSRWPLMIGTTGIVVGSIMILDQVDNLILPLFWTTDPWRDLLGVELAESVLRSLPPWPWLVACSLVKLALGVSLVVGSLSLRRRRKLGVTISRNWAVAAIAWVLFETGWALAWIEEHAEGITGLPTGGWQGTAAIGVLFAAALLLAWPVVLLVWLAGSDVRREIDGWQA